MAVLSKLSKLEEIEDLRTVWPHEAQDFTPWLAKEENIEILSDAIGIDISINETESSVGDFSLDVLASEVGTDKKIIIENQLEDTNHDHLGKLITYASGKSANIIIWLVKHAREEHKAAIEWLNNPTDDEIGFFLCEIKLYRIGNSDPAVKFEVVEKPNDWTKEIKKKNNINETQQQRYDYWVAFQNHAFQDKEFSRNFSRRSPSFDHWMNYSIGSSKYLISVGQLHSRNEITVEFNINEDKELFRSLFANKESIEKECELNFEWKELPEKKASRIITKCNVDFKDKAQWNNQFEWTMNAMLKIKKVFKKYI